jgi:hypothetical protein
MSSKSKTKNDPWKPAQPYIIKGMQQTNAVFDQQQPILEANSKLAQEAYRQLAPGAFGPNQLVSDGQGFLSRTLAGDYLDSNPYLDQYVGDVLGDVGDQVRSEFSQAGRYGSGYNQSILARELGRASTAIRGQEFGNERNRQMQAAGMVPSLRQAEYLGVQPALSLLSESSTIPWTGVAALNGGIRQASQGYGVQTQTRMPGLGEFMSMGAQAAGAAAMSDIRLKSNIERLGTLPNGLGWYEYDILGRRERGVMAQEVAEARPDAMGPQVLGFLTVNYGALGLSGPEVVQ